MLRSLSIVAVLTAFAGAQDASLKFRSVAPGVWAADVGAPEPFSLLSVAGGSPMVAAMKALPDASFPFAKGSARGWARGGQSSLRFPLGAGEDVYGLGLGFKHVRRNRQIMTLHMDHWGATPGRTHAPVPFWVSSQGYGVLVDSARYVRVWVGTSLRKDAEDPPPLRDRNRDRNWQAHPRSDSIDILVPAPGARVYVFAGPTPLDAVRRFVLFSGGGAMPPRWGLGFTHRTPTRFTAKQITAEVDAFDAHGFPLDFIGLEPGWHSAAYPCTFEWDRERFPDPVGVVKALLDRRVRVNLWMNPYVRPGCALHKKLSPHAASHLVWNGIIPDYEVPAARELFTTHLEKETVGIGVSGFKIDEVDGFDSWLWPDVARFPSGLAAEQIRQTYGLRLQVMMYDLFKKRDRRTWGLVRGTNAGAARLPFVIYNDAYSHQDFIRALCSSSFLGVLWTPEVRSSKTGEEWLRRMETVCFSPMAMLNAWSSGTRPWSFPEVEDRVREVALLRMRLMPYLYTAFAEYRFRGVPPMRAMPLVDGWADVGDAATRRERVQDQFFVGDAILVAPLFAGESKRSVLLPKGRWYDFYTGALIGTGGVHEVAPKDGRMPVFVKEGGMVPLGPPLLRAPKPGEGIALEIRHYGNHASRRRLYSDDGETFAFERGEHGWADLIVDLDESGQRTGRIENEDPRFHRYTSVTWRFLGR
ncbi:MAG: ABC transporter substrate-binding protein [Planctomycetes bacterium]|nr:ABC transporter substrate-binding protein [Planctomycetota bacterium]